MTLVEIIAVLVILGLIAGVFAVSLIPQTEGAKRRIAAAQIATIASHLKLFQLEKKELPPTGTGLKALTSPAATPSAPFYLNPEQIVDPWGRPYVYRRPGSGGHPFEILSLGADGQPGGADADADVSSVGASAAQ